MTTQARSAPRNLIELLQDQAQNAPDFAVLTYLRDGEEASNTVTFAQLDQDARVIASALAATTRPGDRVMLLYLPGTEFTSAYFGCLYSARIAVPLPPPRPARLRQTLEKLLAIAASAAPRAVLTSRLLADKAAEFFDELPALREMTWLVSEELDSSLASTWHAPKLGLDDLAFLQYTSGSTALPKGVMLTHGNLLANTDYFAHGCAHGPVSSLVNWLPPFHDLGLIYGLLTPIRLGIAGYIIPNASFVQQPSRWVRAISRYRVSHTMGPNFAFDLALKSVTEAQMEELDLSQWEQALNGAEPVRMETMRAFTERFARVGFRASVFNPSWGLAEASCIVTGSHFGTALPHRPDPRGVWLDTPALTHNRVLEVPPNTPDASWLACSGFPIDDTELAIVDPMTCDTCDAEQVGEIWVRNRAVGVGYWQNPEGTAATFGGQISGDTSGRKWMRTGDLGFLHQGQIVVTGRIKDVIIIRGRNHYPQDIEWTTDRAHSLLRPAGVAAFAVRHEGEELLCLVAEVDRRFSERDEEEVLAAIRSAVSEAHELRPAGIALIRQGTIPKTTSGKVQRRASMHGFLHGTLDAKHTWHSKTLTQAIEKILAQEKAAEIEPLPIAPAPEAKSQAQSHNQTKPASGSDPLAPERAGRILDWLRHRVANIAGIEMEAVKPHQGFSAWGLDSNDAVALSGELEREFSLKGLPPTLLFDYPTPEAVAMNLARQHSDDPAAEPALARKRTARAEAAPAPVAVNAPPAAQPQTQGKPDDIVVVGMAARLPGAADLKSFWALLEQGSQAIGSLPAARRRLPACGSSAAEIHAGWLEDIEQFDPAFFHLSPLEAQQMDPRQRLLLMNVWHALEAAHIPREALAGSKTGVFIGISGQEYAHFALDQPASGHAATGGANSIAANRLSYFLDLRGPSMALDTACSSSLVALHQACQSLRAGECDTAIAAGVNLILDPRLSDNLNRAGMLSPSQRCHSFDAAADGYVRGEGVVSVILRRRSLALAEANPILARIAGSAVNQDGRSFGLTAPNGIAQQEVMRAALAQAGLPAGAVQYVEAHGTGTSLGDPIEWSAIDAVLGQERSAHAPCLVGSVKSNIGHLEAAAGLAGLVKAILCLQHGKLVPLAGWNSPNPKLADTAGRLALANAAQLARNAPRPECIGVTSMGFGGSNAHVIVCREEPAAAAAAPDWPRSALPLSAATPGALRLLAQAYADVLRVHPAQWPQLAMAAAAGRSALQERAVLLADDAQQAGQLLQALASGQQPVATRHWFSGSAPGRFNGKIAFVFGGQGAQRAGMGAQLYRHCPAFREAFDQAVAAFARHDAILETPQPPAQSGSAAPLNHTRNAQPALFTFEYALAQTLIAAGVQPAALFGHSLGEYVAATLAGVLQLEDAALLVASRARLMSQCQGGTMLALMGDMTAIDNLLTRLPPTVELAARNAPGVVTLSGPTAPLQALALQAQQEGMNPRMLPVETAFHSALMDPILAEFGKIAAGVRYAPARLPLYGNLHGAQQTRFDADYWCRHLRHTVQFADCVQAALADGIDIMLELSPQISLAGILRRALPANGLALSSGGEEEVASLLDVLSQLFCRGLTINWRKLQSNIVSPLSLPDYPFDLSPCWLSAHEVSSMQSMNPISAPASVPAAATFTPQAAPPAAPRQSALDSSDITQWVCEVLAELLHSKSDAIDARRSFMESGADSLVLTELCGRAANRFGVQIELATLFEEFDSPQRLGQWISEKMPEERKIIHSAPAPAPASAALPEAVPVPAVAANMSAQAVNLPQAQFAGGAVGMAGAAGGVAAVGTGVQALFEKQLDILRDVISLQMAQLAGTPLTAGLAALPVAAPAAMSVPGVQVPAQAALPTPAPAVQSTPAPLAHPAPAAIAAPVTPVAPAAGSGILTSANNTNLNLDPAKQAHLEQMVKAYTTKTAASRAYAVRYRRVFADYRSSLGFKRAIKEMIYPLVVERGAGSHVTDIDGHDYIDLTMAFGSCLFGHNPPMVIEALKKQLEFGIQVGPKSPLSGRAAQLVADLTGVERVAFANSGTEAVMTAVRLARAVTGRYRIIRFTGAYHGHSDVTLASAGRNGAEGQPGAPGVPVSTAHEVVVLEWGTEHALQQVRELAGSVAAIIAEPVQSRRPGFHPQAFLQELRQLATAGGCALLFDEIITGFRLAPGGAQAYFGVQADLICYGKVAGGGMPIGIIAGRSRFMDAIDGGAWQYGDDSMPRPPQTFFAGTFSAHPLTMASLIAVLERIKEEGPQLYEWLNERTEKMTVRLNNYYQEHDFPIRVNHAGSLFRFVFFGNFSVEFQPIEANLFFYHMILGGVYIWEGHTCFLTTAHSDADIERIVQAAIAGAQAMRQGGFFPRSSNAADVAGSSSIHTSQPTLSASAQAATGERTDTTSANRVLDDFALSAFATTLLTLGWNGTTPADSLLESLSIKQNHASLLGRILEHLVSAGVLEEQLGRYREQVPLQRLASALSERRTAIGQAVPEAIASLVGRCADALCKVLRGESDAVEVLFGDQAFNWLTQLYALAPGANEATTSLVQAVLTHEQSRAHAAQGPLRILEAGAGTGAVARRLLTALGEREVEYWFTDVSPAFLARAKREMPDPRLHFALFDVQRSPLAQELEAGSFDVVLAANVVHATSHLGQTLSHLATLMRKDGILLLQECTYPHAWLDLVFGITGGWWQRADYDVRPNHPLLPPDAWLNCLSANGFVHPQTLIESGGQAVLQAELACHQNLPISSAQAQILVHLEVGEGIAAAYNEGSLCSLEGELDINTLSKSWALTVKRHPLLYSRLNAAGDGFEADPSALPRLQQIDFSMLATQAESRANEWIALRQRTPMEPKSGPLLSAWLLQLAPGHYWLYLIAHHLVIDGLSYGRLLEELWQSYQALRHGQSPALKPVLSPQLACERLDRIDIAQRAYWAERLADLPAPPDLPFDNPLPVMQSFDAGRVSCKLPLSTLQAVRALGAKAQATPFMTLNAVWRLLLARLSGSQRLVLGMPVSVHPESAAQSYVGFAVNVLPLLAEVRPEQSFTDFLRSVRVEVASALANRDFPFAEMVRSAKLERESSRPTLVQVLFNCENHDLWQGSGAVMRTRVPPATHTKYELTLDALLGSDGMEVVLTYSSALFDNSSADRILRRYVALLEAVLAAPEEMLAGFDVLLPEERSLVGINQPLPLLDSCLHQQFEQQAARTPDAVALRFGEECISFRELEIQANRIAHVLLARGAGKEERIAVCLPRKPVLVAAMLAVMKAGAAYVPLDPAYPGSYLETVLRLSGARMVLCEDAAMVSELGAQQCLTMEAMANELKLAPSHAPQVAVGGRQLAYVIFTSGSTGEPKGVAIEHSSVCTFLAWAASEFAPDERAGVLASTSVCFDLSVFELFLPLTHGGRVILVDNVLALTQGEAGTDISLVNTVPSAIAELARQKCLPPNVRVINLAGEALPEVLVDQIRKLWPRLTLCNLYGPTEDTTYSTWLRLPPGDTSQVTIGRPLPGTRLYILNELLLPVPPGAQGEIYLAGNGLARGYLNRPTLTAERFAPDPLALQPGARMYRTGDLGRLRADGTVEYMGRSDDQVKVRGHRIELGAIDSALNHVPQVREAAVVAHGQPLRLTAFYSLKSEAAGAAAGFERQLRASLTETLPRYMIPANFTLLESLPLTPNGKIDRRKLRTMATQATPLDTERSRRAPRNPVEQDVLERFAQYLECAPGAIGIEDDFFLLGGHSLLATRLLFDLNSHWQTGLRLSDLMSNPTVQELAEKLLQEMAPDLGGEDGLQALLDEVTKTNPAPGNQ